MTSELVQQQAAPNSVLHRLRESRVAQVVGATLALSALSFTLEFTQSRYDWWGHSEETLSPTALQVRELEAYRQAALAVSARAANPSDAAADLVRQRYNVPYSGGPLSQVKAGKGIAGAGTSIYNTVAHGRSVSSFEAGQYCLDSFRDANGVLRVNPYNIGLLLLPGDGPERGTTSGDAPPFTTYVTARADFVPGHPDEITVTNLQNKDEQLLLKVINGAFLEPATVASRLALQKYGCTVTPEPPVFSETFDTFFSKLW